MDRRSFLAASSALPLAAVPAMAASQPTGLNWLINAVRETETPMPGLSDKYTIVEKERLDALYSAAGGDQTALHRLLARIEEYRQASEDAARDCEFFAAKSAGLLAIFEAANAVQFLETQGEAA